MTDAITLPRATVCAVRDGRFVDPCGAAADLVGVLLVDVLDSRTRQARSRLLYGLTSSGLTPLRHCPACGVEMPRGIGDGRA